MSQINNIAETYLIATIKNELYGIKCENIIGIIETPKCNKIPNMPSCVRGSFDFRGNITLLVDLRTFLGFETLEEGGDSTINMLKQREQDHINWLKELENSINENRDFKLAKDPTKCAFGKWYYSYKTDNPTLNWFLKQFEKPHNHIHSIANKAIEHSETGHHHLAHDLIEKTRNAELHVMLDLFEKLRNEFQSMQREVTVVIEKNNKMVGITVDQVNSIEDLENQNIHKNPKLANDNNLELFPFLGYKNESESSILLMDLSLFFNSFNE